MKKFLLAFAIIFVVNLSCKKEQRLCGCTVLAPASLQLVVKGAAGEDLLNSATTGAISQNAIRIYQKASNGTEKNINFSIRPPFTFGNEKLDFYQIYSSEIVSNAQLNSGAIYYLSLGNRAPMEVELQLKSANVGVEKVLIDKKEAPKEAAVTKYNLSLFYINL